MQVNEKVNGKVSILLLLHVKLYVEFLLVIFDINLCHIANNYVAVLFLQINPASQDFLFRKEYII